MLKDMSICHRIKTKLMIFFQIKSSRKEYKASQSTSKALYRNFFMVTCDFEEHTNEVLNKSATIGKGFDISLSYDGIHFSRTLSLVIFNPACMSCSSRPLNCHKKVIYIDILMTIL